MFCDFLPLQASKIGIFTDLPLQFISVRRHLKSVFVTSIITLPTNILRRSFLSTVFSLLSPTTTIKISAYVK